MALLRSMASLLVWGLLLLLALGRAGSAGADAPLDVAGKRICPQHPLSAQGKGSAVLFVGGMGDEFTGIMDAVRRNLPPLVPGQEETRAYYLWHGGLPESATTIGAARRIAADIAAFRQANPHADVVLIGHSMGGSAALRAAALLSPADGAVYLLTLDPVDRSTKPERPASVTWWGNAYITFSPSPRECIVNLGGRWKHCPQADLNIDLTTSADQEDAYQQYHGDAMGLLMRSRDTQPLFHTLRQRLRLADSKRPTGATTTGTKRPAPTKAQ